METPKPTGTLKEFYEIFAEEIEAINARRKTRNRSEIDLEVENWERDKTPILRPRRDNNVIGLALSGGGIRSAAFCLGVLQALDARDITDKIDYLSTVSGGGYIGTSMTVAMSKSPSGEFPFNSKLLGDEVPGLQHIRDYSNYLFPKGFKDIPGNVAVYLRGLMANVVLLLPVLLILAAITMVLIKIPHFWLVVAPLPAIVTILFFVGWALWRSSKSGQNCSDVGIGANRFGWLLVAILVIGFIGLQPFLLDKMLNAPDLPKCANSFWNDLKSAAPLLAPIVAAVGFLGRFLANTLKRTSEKQGFQARATHVAANLAMYVVGAAAPATLCVASLYLSLWSIRDCTVPSNLLAFYYFMGGFVLLAVGWFLKPNANSLHRLYRDRLSKAFLFDPAWRVDDKIGKTSSESDKEFRNCDLKPLGDLKLSELVCSSAPYHLINAALNIEASKDANRRGRNADFFIFSPLYVGSRATGYVKTEEMEMEKEEPGLTVGTAMAISGAAASSNMGSATIKPLVPALAMLNFRLGYWLANPAKVAGALKKPICQQLGDELYFFNEFLGRLDENSEKVYLTDGGHIENLGIYELLRRRCKLIIAVDAEADPEMSFGSFLTLERYAWIDFGIHIELPWEKVRDAAQKVSKQILRSGKTPSDRSSHGPHCALGTISYPSKEDNANENSTGLLLYIKSSITGDERDYILDYKRRNSDFPHETTMDQMFSEEQFEVYRSLGFHAAQYALDRKKGQIAVDKVSLVQTLFNILAINGDSPALG